MRTLIRRFGKVGGLAEQTAGLDVGAGYGNALPSHVLSGKSFGSASNVQQFGTMQDFTDGLNTADEARSINDTIEILPPKGYHDGVTSWVYAADPNFDESNIKQGVPIFGKTGTFDGKRQASGVSTSYGTGTEYVKITGATPFTPRFVIAKYSFYHASIMFAAIPEVQPVNYFHDVLGSLSDFVTAQGSAPGQFQLRPDGFDMIVWLVDPHTNGQQWTWWAFE